MHTVTMTRRRVLQMGVVAGGALVVPWYMGSRPAGAVLLPGGTLDPTAIPKYVEALPRGQTLPKKTLAGGVDYYEIAVRQFQQRIVPAGFPLTTVWGYGSALAGATSVFATPTMAIEARYGGPVRVKWVNQLVDAKGRYLPSLAPVDPTLHWANPPGGSSGRDMRPTFTTTPGRYTGPVPLVTHVHGAHVNDDSDGYPEGWYLPAGTNIPSGYATEGTWYGTSRRPRRRGSAPPGRREARRSSTPTISPRRCCGSTTTRWA
jgi:spore coat protein A